MCPNFLHIWTESRGSFVLFLATVIACAEEWNRFVGATRWGSSVGVTVVLALSEWT